MHKIVLTAVIAVTCCTGAAASPLTNIMTVFVIVMENHNWSDIYGSTNAPYINGVLLPMASHCEQYTALPAMGASLPNYLWLEAGTNFGIFNNLSPYDSSCQTATNLQFTTNHLVTLLNDAGIAWKAYMEDAPTNTIELSDYNRYTTRHNPFAYFADIIGTNHDASTCTADYAYGVAHIRPYTELAGDLASNTVAKYNFITPNLCHDMHDPCPPLTNLVLQGDTWLASELPQLLNSQAYQSNGVVFITWDEGLAGSGTIGMIVLSPLAKGGGYANAVYYTHSSTLRTMQTIFGVTPWLGDAANAADLSDLFSDSSTGFAISHLARGADGVVELTVVGVAPGTTTVVEESSNLVTWVPVVTNTATTGSFSVTDSTSTNSAAGFYRAHQVAH